MIIERLRITLPWMTFWLVLSSLWAIRSFEGPAVTLAMLGVAGTLMMLFTELAYTYRKRGVLHFGSVRSWLTLHVFTGIAGPVLIIIHTGFKFYGFAGWLAIFTIFVVLSGSLGRLLFSKSHRPSGRAKEVLAIWRTVHCIITILLFSGVVVHVISVFFFGRVLAQS